MATDVISVTMSGTQREITVRYCHGGATHRLRLSAWEDTETFTVDATKAALQKQHPNCEFGLFLSPF